MELPPNGRVVTFWCGPVRRGEPMVLDIEGFGRAVFVPDRLEAKKEGTCVVRGALHVDSDRAGDMCRSVRVIAYLHAGVLEDLRDVRGAVVPTPKKARR